MTMPDLTNPVVQNNARAAAVCMDGAALGCQHCAEARDILLREVFPTVPSSEAHGIVAEFRAALAEHGNDVTEATVDTITQEFCEHVLRRSYGPRSQAVGHAIGLAVKALLAQFVPATALAGVAARIPGVSGLMGAQRATTEGGAK